jgi:disulfide bond formation protein DsbB
MFYVFIFASVFFIFRGVVAIIKKHIVTDFEQKIKCSDQKVYFISMVIINFITGLLFALFAFIAGIPAR